MDDNMKVKKALSMFVDLFGLERFEYDTLVRFFITVRKNYRHVAYHNWTHGFHVANSIYCILKSSPGIFKPLEVSLHLIFSRKTNSKFKKKVFKLSRSIRTLFYLNFIKPIYLSAMKEIGRSHTIYNVHTFRGFTKFGIKVA